MQFVPAARAEELPVSFHIAAQPLVPALRAFAEQAHMQLFYKHEFVEGATASAVVGSFRKRAALEQLLRGTGLETVFTADDAATIGPKQTGAPARRISLLTTDDGDVRAGLGDTSAENADDGQRTHRLEEVIVTAQKRTELLRDVPVPLTALEAGAMTQQGKTRLEDYFASVPGLSLNAIGGGQQTIAVRGLATASIANPTVAVSIDDVPFGSSTFMGRGSTSYPDIDPSELARIEVLRGPQGTLYGASSIGGLLKFVTLDPSTDGVTGQVQLGSTAIDRGNVGYGASGAVNVPVSDDFAVRGSAFKRREPGYVHNLTTGQRYVDESDTSGGHLSALWRLSDAVTLKVSGLLQKNEGDGSASVDTSIGGLKQTGLPGTGWYRNEAQLYSAVLTADLGSMDLTSVSGYARTENTDAPDFSALAVAFGGFDFFGVTGGALPETFRTRRITQEIRLASKTGQKIEWLGGVFFNDERSPSRSVLTANDAATGELVGTLATYDVLSTLREYSLFGNLTVHFTERFDVQFGARQAEIKQRYEETDTGLLAAFIPDAKTRGDALTYLLTPRWKLSDDMMVYARFASGYRPGGANVNALANGHPLGFEPDKAYSYEFGAKGVLLDGLLSIDSSVYYVDWKNVQIEISDAVSFFRDNVGGARSQGAELAAQLYPADGLTLALALALNDAELTDDFPPGSAMGRAGDRLPFSAKFTSSFSVDQEFALTDSVSSHVGGAVTYVGKRFAEFPSAPPPGETATRPELPSYVTFDLRAGARYDSWSIDLFLNNVADKRGLLGGGRSANNAGDTVFYVQPRTAGLTVTKEF